MSGKSKWLHILFVVIVALSLLLALTLARAAPVDDYVPEELSYGLYWFGKNNVNQKFVSGESNDYFDPAKPTLIFAHGWQPYLSLNLPNFDFKGTDTIAAWIDDGWNVGIFVWNQFSDETTGLIGEIGFPGGEPPQGVLDAEAKVWTPDGPQGMRWRDWDDLPPLGDGYSDGPSDKCAADLFYEEYVAALAGYTGTIRIAGHSLGNQMAVRLTKLVNDGIAAGEVSEHLRPTRVALLDPYWSPSPRTYLGGKTTGDVVRDYIAELLPTGTLFEWYWSSDWTTPNEGDANEALKPMVLYAAMDPAYVSSGLDKHMAANHLYFWSYGFPQAPPCAGVGDDCRLLAQMGDAQLASLMRSDYRWAQSEGQSTDTPGDDVYTATQQADAPYVVAQLQANAPTQAVGGVITVTAMVTSTASPAPDGTLVTFGTDLGDIWVRTTTSGGVALALVTSDVAGTAHISATTQGTGGEAQSTLDVTFTGLSVQVPPDEVNIGGPTIGVVATPYTFTATVEPISVTLPLTTIWQATGQTPVTRTGVMSITDVFSFTWDVTGTQYITVTAMNLLDARSGAHTIVISESLPACLYPLTGAAIAVPPGVTDTLYVDTPYTFTAVITPTDATPPITYTWSPAPINGQNHSSGIYQWATPATYTLTLAVENCGGPVEAVPRVVVVKRDGYSIYLPLVLR